MSAALERLKKMKTLDCPSAKSDETPLMALLALPQMAVLPKSETGAVNDLEPQKSEKRPSDEVPKLTKPTFGTYGTSPTQRFQELEPLSDMGQKALDALAAHGWTGESALKVARLIEGGETDEDVLVATLDTRT